MKLGACIGKFCSKIKENCAKKLCGCICKFYSKSQELLWQEVFSSIDTFYSKSQELLWQEVFFQYWYILFQDSGTIMEIWKIVPRSFVAVFVNSVIRVRNNYDKKLCASIDKFCSKSKGEQLCWEALCQYW